MSTLSSANAARDKTTNTLQAMSVHPRRTSFMLQTKSKLSTSTIGTTSSSIGHRTSSLLANRSLESCSTSSDSSDDETPAKGKDSIRQFPSSGLSFRNRHLEQIWSPHSEAYGAQSPTRQKASSSPTDSLWKSCKMPRWSNDRINDRIKSITDWISPVDTASVYSASTTASPIATKGNVYEKCKTIESSTAPNQLLKFLFKCMDTDSDEKVSIVDLRRTCSKYPEVATFLAVDHPHKGSRGFDEFLTSGKSGITEEDLCRFISVRGGIRKTEMSLQTRRKLAYDFMANNSPFVTLFTIAHVCVQHPIFLKFVIPLQNAHSLDHVTDYFNKVDSAGRGAFSSKQQSFDDFCFFFDHVCSWNAKSRPIASAHTLLDELMMFIGKNSESDKKLGVGNDAEGVAPPGNGHIVPTVLSPAREVWTTKVAPSKKQWATVSQSQILCDVDPPPRPDMLSAPRSTNFEDSTFQRPRQRTDFPPSSPEVSDQCDALKEVVCFSDGSVVLGRDKKPIWRSGLSFKENSGVLIGPDGMMVLDENGHPYTRNKLYVAADGKPALDDNHRLIKKLESTKVVQKEVVEKKADVLAIGWEKLSPASGQSRHPEVLPDMMFLDPSGDVLLGRDGLPVTKGEAVLSPNGDFLLCSAGHLILQDDLHVGDDGSLLGPDQLPVTDMRQNRTFKADDLLLSCEGLPVISKDGNLVTKADVMHVGCASIPLRDVTIQSDGTFHGPDGKEILGEDGFALIKGEVLMGDDDKPLLTSEGKPILQHDLMFSNKNVLCGPGGMLLRNESRQPLLRENIYVGTDGRPRLSHAGKVVEIKDVLHNFSGTPLLAAAFNEPITRTDLKFSKQGTCMGLGTVIRRKNGTPYMRGDVLMNTDGKPLLDKDGCLITESAITFPPNGAVFASGLHLQGSDNKPLRRKDLFLDADERPKFTMEGRLMELKDLVHKFNGEILFDSEQNPVARSELAFATDGRLITTRGIEIKGGDGAPVMKGEVVTDRDGRPLLSASGQLILEKH